MNVNIKIPESLEDITVGQYQEIDRLSKVEGLTNDKLDDEIIKVVTGFNNVGAISKRDRNILIQDIYKALKQDGKFHQTFVLNGIDFGLIPNFDNITNGEYADLIKYSESDEHMHKLLAVAYRPIKHKNMFKDYTIVNYEGTKYNAERMKELPMSIANGVIGFFLNGYNDLKIHLLTSMAVEQTKDKAL